MIKFNKLEKSSKKTIKKRPRTKKTVIEKDTVLSTTISESYEGKVDGVIKFIRMLPVEIQQIIHSNDLKGVLTRQGYTLFTFKDKVTLKVKDEKIGKKRFLRIVVKSGRKEHFNNIING